MAFVILLYALYLAVVVYRKSLNSGAVRKSLGGFYYDKIASEKFKASQELKLFLEFNVPYYQLLTAREKQEFEYRILQITETKQFIGEENFVVTNEHEWMIASALAMLTFGYSQDYLLEDLLYIRIYPGTFYSKLIDKEVKGLTVSRHSLFLSWQHVEEGFEDYKDSLNLALHEFAHALIIHLGWNNGMLAWDSWQKEAYKVMLEMEQNDDHFFRSYGAVNMHEFWAVSCESFFEEPIEFQQKFPALYRSTSRFLNQSPALRQAMAQRNPHFSSH